MSTIKPVLDHLNSGRMLSNHNQRSAAGRCAIIPYKKPLGHLTPWMTVKKYSEWTAGEENSVERSGRRTLRVW